MPGQLPAPYMTPSPSELSIFGEVDVDEEVALVEDELNGSHGHGPASHDDRNGGAPHNDAPGASSALSSSAALTKTERQKLTRELLDALYLGTSNFLLAYNTRAGIGVLLRIFKLLVKRFVALALIRSHVTHSYSSLSLVHCV